MTNIIAGNKENPIVIEPERYQHVIIKGTVEFKVEFYKLKDDKSKQYDGEAERPGENFL